MLPIGKELTGHFSYWTVRPQFGHFTYGTFHLLPGQFTYKLLILHTRLPE